MPERERPTLFPSLPELYPRPVDLVPTAALAGDVPDNNLGQTEPAAMAGEPLPVAAGPRDSATIEPPTPTGEPAPPEAGERERVHLAGRLGQDPKLRTTPK